MGNCYSCKKQVEHCFYVFEKYYTISLEQRYVNNVMEIQPLVQDHIIEDDIEAQTNTHQDLQNSYINKNITILPIIEDIKEYDDNKHEDDLFDDFEII